MLDFSSPRQIKRVYALALFGVALSRFLNLGFLDLQAWDEALYAVRSVGILQFGGIFDQTSFSIGGLYSSLHPPLYVWLTSVSFLVFGVTEFAARFFSAVFGGLTLMVIYKIGKEIHSSKVGFIAAMLFGLNPFVSFYARQGQFDTTLVFFLSLSVLYLLRYESRGKLSFALVGGLAIGAALMTKLFVGCGILESRNTRRQGAALETHFCFSQHGTPRVRPMVRLHDDRARLRQSTFPARCLCSH